MNGHVKTRIAVGVFHDITRLRDTLYGLAAIGCSGDDTVLVCDPGAMDRGFEQQLAALEHPVVSSMKTLVRTSWKTEPDQPQDDGPPVTRDRIPHFETWLPSRYALKLDDHLKRGGCILFSTAPSEAQEQEIAKVLLQFSADPVQLHDLPPTS